MPTLNENRHVTIDVPWDADEPSIAKTRVGMLPAGVGVRARLGDRVRRAGAWMRSKKWWLAGLMAAAAMTVVAVEVAPDMMTTAKPQPVAIKKKAPVAAKKTAAPKKKTAAPAVKNASMTWEAAPKATPSDLLQAGHIYLRAGKMAAAEDAYKEALEKGDREARFWVATAQSSQGEKWRACRNFKKYVAENPNGAHAFDARMNLKACD